MTGKKCPIKIEILQKSRNKIFFWTSKSYCFWPSMVYANKRNIYSSNDTWENCNTL